MSDIVAVLEANSERVGYVETIVLRADKSYDPDRVNVRRLYVFGLANF